MKNFEKVTGSMDRWTDGPMDRWTDGNLNETFIEQLVQ